MNTDCPGCKPGATTRAFTAEDYKRALEMLAEREDLTPAQREQARAWLDAQSKEAG